MNTFKVKYRNDSLRSHERIQRPPSLMERRIYYKFMRNYKLYGVVVMFKMECCSGLVAGVDCACTVYPCSAVGAGAALIVLFFPAALHVLLIIYSLMP